MGKFLRALYRSLTTPIDQNETLQPLTAMELAPHASYRDSSPAASVTDDGGASILEDEDYMRESDDTR